eukprot:CAMPEP_0179086410 /NCGR_PEP_ID=MMETSP0796-20121207/39196_1 /TAXON_ID=73915 /ORGANISM="Pyrodinium bahamense, Strain pbaha01" /LENGTH=46 /DNA_ID= /DNA_START= /DNA_END= /DNA_ORIENTATION=
MTTTATEASNTTRQGDISAAQVPTFAGAAVAVALATLLLLPHTPAG